MNPYDEIQYPSQVVPQTHPDRLATIATLRGLAPAPPSGCRMLDIGCGTGLNVISCALTSPDSEFVGVDLASVPIAQGQAMAATLGLRNVRLLVGDAASPDPSWGTFDYVAAHGVYSWVPAPVRERLLATVAACLRPGGVGYVSYLALPGGFAQNMFREVLLLHAGSAPAGPDRVRRSLELLQLLAAARSRPGDPWSDWTHHEVESRVRTSHASLRHDDLGEVRDPVWFHQFAAHAARHRLRYLAEAEWTDNTDVDLAPAVRDVLDAIEDPVVREQYRDITRFRRFRRTLVVHESVTPTREAQADRVADLFVAGDVSAPEVEVPLERAEVETFSGPRRSRASTDSAIARAALRVLRESWPRLLPFSELFGESLRRVEAARSATGASSRDAEPYVVREAEERETLCRIVLSLYDAGVVSLHSRAISYARSAGERPVASPLARLLLQQGSRVVSLLHDNVELQDARSQRLIAMLDGTVDRAEILRRMIAAEVPPDAPPPDGVPPLTEALLETTLAELARRAMLTA